jgi:iron complex transport system substrate-binding protein
LLSLIYIFIIGCEIDSGNEEKPEIAEEETELLPYPVIINDTEIEKQPEMIVSLSPALTEMIFEFGEDKKLVGRCNYCDYPKAVTDVKNFGSSARPDIDGIIGLKPDLLLISTPLAAKDLLTMESHGIKTLLFESPKNLDEFKRAYEGLGLALNGLFTGTEVGEQQFSEISKVFDNSDVINIGKFAYITEDLKIAAGGTLEHAVFSCFGDNIAKDREGYVSPDDLFDDVQPDIIILNDKYNLNRLKDHDVYSGLSAVDGDRVIYVTNLYFERPTVRITELIEKFILDYKSLDQLYNRVHVPAS